MFFSKLFAPTLRESPADAEVISHQLMIRAGMIRKVAAGIYNLLPLGTLVMQNVERIVREELTRAGAQEVVMPVVIPSELWRESGRWEEYGKELLRVKDRHGRDFCLGPTHEEVVTDMVRRDVKSYKGLPLNLYQIQTKFRDEIRPRFGLMRGREFVMKDAYSFHANEESAKEEYDKMFEAYSNIFRRCGLKFRAVEADSGNIGGSFSHEFMVLADTGEDEVVSCNSCDYAANTERAELKDHVSGQADHIKAQAETPEPKEVSTPGKKTIEEVSGLLGVPASKFIKTLVYDTDNGPVVALVRGLRNINEAKLRRAAGVARAELATDAVVEEITGAPRGFAGPVGLGDVRIIADFDIRAITEGVTGANKVDTHLLNVLPGRDFTAEYADLRTVEGLDKCPRCDKGRFEIHRGIEVGHIFMLGTKYSEAMDCTFIDEDGKSKPMIMGCYGIGIGRTAAAAIEQNHDDNGIKWPVPLAPYHVAVVLVDIKNDDLMEIATSLYYGLMDRGIPALLDERNERPGVRFKDIDLIGIPVRVTISKKTAAEESVEIKARGGEMDLFKYDKTMEEIYRLLGMVLPEQESKVTISSTPE